MRARYKAPSGTGIIELPDDATLDTLLGELRTKSGISSFTIKYGPPMAMKSLDLSQRDQTAKSLGLHGETLTIVPDEARPVSPLPQDKTSETVAQRQPEEPSKKGPEDVHIPWPDREGTLLLRVMPSDNSCLFTAFGGALPQQIAAHDLRRMMAEYISKHPDVYSEAILGSPPAQYCRSIQDPDRWGGGIELSILSTLFDIQISTYDVQAQNLINFGEDKQLRCILVYSGIHYDRVAFSYSEAPHDHAPLPPDMDRTRWPTDDDEVLEKTKQLVSKLNDAHYYTDTEGLILRCDVPGCDWIGNGQHEGRKHAELTGHTDMSEIKDTEEDNTLRRCDAFGCDFMGQGSAALSRHTLDTTHKKFSIIPDF
jgi:ubiquitin thioesterase OTU1